MALWKENRTRKEPQLRDFLKAIKWSQGRRRHMTGYEGQERRVISLVNFSQRIKLIFARLSQMKQTYFFSIYIASEAKHRHWRQQGNGWSVSIWPCYSLLEIKFRLEIDYQWCFWCFLCVMLWQWQNKTAVIFTLRFDIIYDKSFDIQIYCFAC